MKTVNSSSIQSNNTSSGEDLFSGGIGGGTHDDRLKDFGRRLSIIGKPPAYSSSGNDGLVGSEDGQEFKNYLDDLRSNRNSPLEVRER